MDEMHKAILGLALNDRRLPNNTLAFQLIANLYGYADLLSLDEILDKSYLDWQALREGELNDPTG